ncbi:metal-dependent protein hydrolase [Phakopsora pachyrhizi]|uniref:Metal-dependent protein hydrolase n=1 Tax=Phakopsora pachyrhizi TaxID=170000 RepID=A0AAV0AYI3_PHAPC|nr:metal-dependent protein hydrolase [Phakopsora pachyrhizi]
MSENKKIKLSEKDQVVIGTHSGTFHADEALAVGLLRSLDQYKSSKLIRTRDPDRLAECDIVVDVGGDYDHPKHRYDHHQRGFEETYSSDHSIKLSSAGLVYKHFGADIISNYLNLPKEDPQVSVLVLKLYDFFIQAIDGVDNGIFRYEAFDENNKDPLKVNFKPKYHSGTSLSDRVSHLNPAWNEPNTPETFDAQFEKASTLATSEFFSRLDYYFKAWLPCRDIVLKSLTDRFNNEAQDPQGRVLIFQTHCPWKDHLYGLEKTIVDSSSKLPLYVIYPDESKNWRIQCIPKIIDSFESRMPLPDRWRGLRDDELSKTIEVPNSIFVHGTGFIGGNKTFEGVLEMAKKALLDIAQE